MNLHKCTINDDHMINGSWDINSNRQIFLTSWAIFCPFTPLTARKMKIPKKRNKHLEISSFYTSVPKIMIICFTVPEIWHMTHVTFIFHFGLFFALLPPNSPKNENIKKWKKCLELSSFYMCSPKIMIRWCMVPEIWCETDGWTDGWKKWQRGGCPHLTT